jgi:hypothetical protein
VDGSKFKAVDSRDRNFTPHKLEPRMKQIQESIDRCLQALDTADRIQRDGLPARTARLQDELGKLRRQMNDLREVEQQLQQPPDQQLSQTDPDARSMATSGRGTGIAGYNVQIATDTVLAPNLGRRSFGESAHTRRTGFSAQAAAMLHAALWPPYRLPTCTEGELVRKVQSRNVFEASAGVEPHDPIRA